MTFKPIKAVKNGDRDTAEKIVIEHYDAIYKYCYWKLGNSEDAQDITQEVFLKFVLSINNYSEQGKPRALLYTIAKNLCINFHKKFKEDYLDITKEIIDFSASDKFNQISEKLDLEELVKQLPENQQEVIVLRYGHELKIKEIAAITGTTRFTVRYRIDLALSTLKSKLSRRDFIEEKFRKQLT
ncbi:MAG: RNA polymerase sigma factor [Romboutsia sp.]